MTIKTTLSFTDRHHRFVTEKVEQGVFASQSAAIAAALELMLRDEEERQIAIQRMEDEILARLTTSHAAYVDETDAFAQAKARINDVRDR